jgi:hypothetical protein
MKFRFIYLLLALIGLIATWYFNFQFYATANDTSIINFINQTVTTIPAKSISADISVVATTFLIWMVHESLRLKIKYWWIIIPLTFLVALAFSFPVFLFMRDRHLERLSKTEGHDIYN